MVESISYAKEKGNSKNQNSFSFIFKILRATLMLSFLACTCITSVNKAVCIVW